MTGGRRCSPTQFNPAIRTHGMPIRIVRVGSSENEMVQLKSTVRERFVVVGPLLTSDFDRPCRNESRSRVNHGSNGRDLYVRFGGCGQ